ncbi:LOW QUALITY PROTEIN: probable G-protein coupled receptor 179 [Megalobrama amblycephala]|uniref:LOW QUALITY PROTEIN: probable G-protein coupled receptor 179 n=1 Tax=Megalobrama amblycephala TaxID=75352 RepID=UPI002013C37F|nr:LOW QUALITY PROTEIN: probable G-protein coupled receptor 179 [Megalobrama amblycephala]
MGLCACVLPLLLLLPSLLSAQLSNVSEVEDTSSLEFTPTPTNPNTLAGKSSSPSPLPTSPAPVKVSTEEDRSAVENYLYTANSSSLAASTCTQAFQLPVQRGSPPRELLPLLHQAIASLTNAANFLNLIFQASELRETSVREDIEWYHALVRAMLEGDRPGLVRRAFLTFDADPIIQQPQLVLRASKGTTQDILLQDLTSGWSSFRPPAPDQSWFDSFKSSSPPLHALSKRVLLNDLSTLDTPKWARGDSYVINSSGVQWGEAPFLECVDGRFLPGWLLSLSMPFYGLKPDLSPEFRGVIRVDVNVQGFNVDHCASGDFWFANTHQCNRTSMECEPIPQQGFRMGQYCCRCKKGYYSPNPDIQNKRNNQVNSTQACYPEVPVCLPCWPGCAECEDGGPCWVQEDWLLRTGVLAVQGLFMVLVLISMLVAYQCRSTKRIRSSGLLLLEMILCGSLLLYFPVFILYFKPSTFRCILLRWVRLLGFAIVYGTVTLKMYRVLRVFLSRTAQRVPYITTRGVLRMLGVIVLTVSWFLCAWTVGVLQNRDRNVPLLIISTTSEGQGFNVCDLDRWDYMMAVAELLFLCWGSFLCSAVKAVPSAFHEPRYMTIAIHNELLLSSVFHLLRFARPSIHPDWMLLLFFAHTHVTITVTLGLLFVPKFLHMSRPGREEIAAEVYEEEVELRRSCSYLNSSFTSNCWSDHSLDPDDIRDELKKLYSQLEVHKTKRMANSNPHLPKKRSSRLSIGRSLIKRITEIPESLSRQCSREDKDVSAAIGTISRSGSYYKVHQTTSINTMTETLMQPSPKLRKSHSAYDCTPEREVSLLSSSIKSTTAKRASQHSDAGSINTTLLVCKSASTHNLSLDTNLLLPEPTRFQKSLSVIERNDHRSVTTCRSIENVSLPGKAAPAEKPLPTVDVDIKKQTSSALLSESFDKAEVCPWEVPEELPANKNQKHVTYSLSNQDEPKSPGAISSPTLLYVCPWEYLPPPSPPATETGNGIQSDIDSTKPKPPISCSAPGSPHTVSCKPKDFRVFSFHSATHSLLAAKGIGELGRSMSREKSLQESNVKEGTLQKSLSTSMRLSPGSATSDKRTPQTHRRAMTTVGTKPSLVKQTAIRLPSTDSPEKSPKHIAPVHICPWESEEVILEVKKQNVNDSVLQRQYSDKQVLSMTVNNDGFKATELQLKSLLSVPNPEVCPWDVPKPFHQTSISDVCPWEVVEVEQLQTKSIHTDVCPWETDCDPSRITEDNLCNTTVEVPTSGDTQKQVNVKPEACPSYVIDTNISQVRQGSIQTHSDTIKPGERVIYVNARQSPVHQEPAQRDACSVETSETLRQEESDFPEPPPPVTDISPWQSESNTKGTKRPSLKETMPKKATVCPWEVEDSEKLDEREGATNKESMKVDQEQDTVKIIVCPWETSESVKSIEKEESVCGDVCPWETSENVKTFLKPQSVLENVCPWETGEITKTLQKQESIHADVCPRETKDPTKALQKQKSAHEDACPWETGEPTKTLQKQDSVLAHVCPWETGEPTKTLQKQDSVLAHVCPWETGEPAKTLQKQESVRADVCPWETGEAAKALQKQDSVLADVCPWETGEPAKTLQKQESVRADVCPWETGEPAKALQKQDSVLADVCPWETGEPAKTLQKQESVRADVCPWETGEPAKALQKQESVLADVCPWETGEPAKTLQKQESVRADVCPWETGEPAKALQKQDSVLADVCPWETAEPVKTLQKQESVYSDVCPQEAKASPKQSEPQDCIHALPSKRQDSTQGSVYPRENDMEMTAETTESSKSQPAPDIHPSDLDTRAVEETRVNPPLARRDAMCPWEMEGGRQESITVHDNSDVFTWEEAIPEEDDGDAETAAEAFIFPSDL